MPFECDPKSWRKVDGDMLTTATQKIYKSALNKLAKEGWENKEALLEHEKDVVEYIKGLEIGNRNKRIILSAIFKVLADVPHDKQAGYYSLFKSIKTD